MLKLVKFDTAETYEPEKDWKRTSLCNEAPISIEHFIKPAQHASPDHNHPASQVLVVLEGQLEIITHDESVIVEKGDAVFIPGDEMHVVKNPLDVPSIGLDIFVPGRSFDFWTKRGLGK